MLLANCIFASDFELPLRRCWLRAVVVPLDHPHVVRRFDNPEQQAFLRFEQVRRAIWVLTWIVGGRGKSEQLRTISDFSVRIHASGDRAELQALRPFAASVHTHVIRSRQHEAAKADSQRV